MTIAEMHAPHATEPAANIRFILIEACAPVEHWSVRRDGQEIGTISRGAQAPFNAFYRCWRGNTQTATPPTFAAAMAHFRENNA